MVDTRFKKGQIPWNKDLKGIHLSPNSEFKKGQPAPNKKEPIVRVCKCGKVFSVKPSLVRVQSCSRSCAQKGKASPWKGRKASEETRLKQSLAKIGIRGENHWNWRGGYGTERSRLMQQKDYILWRTAVFMRDDYTCQSCDIKGGTLNADHIKPWALYPELRYAIDNGRTLCVECHRKTDTWGNKSMYRKGGA